MAKQRCQDMLEDLLYEAVDAGAANRNVSPQKIGHFMDRCVRTNASGSFGRRRKRAVRRRSRR